MPKSALTGTQKNAQKRDIKFQKKLQDKYLRELSMDRPTRRALSEARISDLAFNKDIQERFIRDLESSKGFKKTSTKQLENIAKGKTGLTTSLSDLMSDFRKTQSLGEKYFEPMKRQALSEFDQFTRPDVVGKFAEGSSGSSALNQALAAARVNLSSQLASNLAGMNLGLGQGLMAQREQNKLAGLQAQLQAAGTGYGTHLNPSLAGLGVGTSYGVGPSSTGLASTNPYLSKSGGASTGSTLLGAGIGALGTIGGGMMSGPIGSAIGGMFAPKIGSYSSGAF